MNTLNLAAGNMYKAATNLAKTNVELMQLQQELRADTASGINSMQQDCFHAGMNSATSLENAMEKEATGLMDSGIASAVGAGVSFATLVPHNLGFGSTALKNELDDAKASENNSSTLARRTMGDPAADEGDTELQTIGHAEISRNPTEAEKKQTEKNRIRELEKELYEQVSKKKIEVSQAANTISSTVGSMEQSKYKTEQAKDQAISSEEQTQAQVFQEDLKGLTNFADNAQQAAGNFGQESLSILATLNTQG